MSKSNKEPKPDTEVKKPKGKLANITKATIYQVAIFGLGE